MMPMPTLPEPTTFDVQIEAVDAPTKHGGKYTITLRHGAQRVRVKVGAMALHNFSPFRRAAIVASQGEARR